MYQIVLKIDGMMCGMCEAHINDTIRKAFKVKKVKSSRRKKQTVIETEEILSEDEIRAALDPTGYRVTDYRLETK